MAEQSGAPAATPVTDHRPVPSGVVPRRFQTWLMVGLAAGIVLIILLTGERQPPMKQMPAAVTPAAPSPDRVREYQERLREIEARQVLDSQPVTPVPSPERRYEPPPAPRPEDPVAADRKRREFTTFHLANPDGLLALHLALTC